MNPGYFTPPVHDFKLLTAIVVEQHLLTLLNEFLIRFNIAAVKMSKIHLVTKVQLILKINTFKKNY